MNSRVRLRADLGAALAGADPGLSSADSLCLACVEFLAVDGAAISLVQAGATQGTFGSSGDLSRRLDEFQFTYGEGPCLDAVGHQGPVLVGDLADRRETRWPAYSAAVLDAGIRAVFALPVAIASSWVGALDLYRTTAGSLTADDLAGSLMAAELAAVPLLDLMTAVAARPAAGEEGLDAGNGWDQLASLQQVEIYQATGMIIGRLDVDAAEALVRLRAHAFTTGRTASEVAWDIVERRLVLEDDDPRGHSDEPEGRRS